MNILLQTVQLFNTKIAPLIGKRHRKLFSFGFQALTLQDFVSLNSNARSIVSNRSTAESKIFRLVSKIAVHEYFPYMASSLGLVEHTDVVNVDFSSFCGFEVLTFARQTLLGRAIPLYFSSLTYPIILDEKSQTLFTIREIKKFKEIFGFYPSFVFDRGFTLPLLVEFMIEEGITFYLRMKKDKYVEFLGKIIPIRNLPWYENDCRINVYSYDLRVVVSERRGTEPWYILTNDFISTRDKVISRYYFRFEIEETFKDLKHVGRLKKFFIKKKLTFSILLWFLILSVWLSFLVTKMRYLISRRVKINTHKRLSFIKQFFESISQARNLLVMETIAM
jgi:hypothetical protein